MKPHFPAGNASLDPHKNGDKRELLWIKHLIPIQSTKNSLSIHQQVLPTKATWVCDQAPAHTRLVLQLLSSQVCTMQWFLYCCFFPLYVSEQLLNKTFLSPPKRFLSVSQAWNYITKKKIRISGPKQAFVPNTPRVKTDKKNTPLFLDKKRNR